MSLPLIFHVAIAALFRSYIGLSLSVLVVLKVIVIFWWLFVASTFGRFDGLSGFISKPIDCIFGLLVML